VRKRRSDPATKALGVVKQPQLPQDCGAVVIDLLASQSVLGVERVDAAKGKIDWPAGCWNSAPCSQMMATDANLEDNRIFARVTAVNVDVEIRQGLEQFSRATCSSTTFRRAETVLLEVGAVIVLCFLGNRR
jgi:hypothetical protein